MIEVLILAAIALFVLSRLYVALGRDDGPPEGLDRGATGDRRQGPVSIAEDDVREPQPRQPLGFTGPAAAGLNAIREADNDFDPTRFVQGARAAYEMIVSAFARGDRDELRPLLDDDVYAAWDAAIGERETSGEDAWQLVRLRTADIDAAELDGRTARVTVRYQSELGNGEYTRSADELWIFKRDVTSGDPNWILDDVEAPDAN